MRAVGGITAAVGRGTITEGRAGALIAGLITPSMAAAQAAERIQPLTPADIAARKAREGTRVDLLGALSLREVADACRKRPGPWYCLNRWPGGWLSEDNLRERGIEPGPPWIGPTQYGVFVAGCFGHKYDPIDTVGRWIIRTTAAAPSAISAPLARLWQALVPTPAAVPGAPPAPAPPPDDPSLILYRCDRAAVYPEVGEIREGTGASPWIIAALADPRFTCRVIGRVG